MIPEAEIQIWATSGSRRSSTPLIENRSGYGAAAIQSALKEWTEQTDELARSLSKNSSKPDTNISGN